MPQADIRVMTGRVRRAVEGVGAPIVLTDDEIKDLIADSCADIILYSGNGIFGKDLLITLRGVNNEAEEYATTDELTLPEQSVVGAQAALTHFFYTFSNAKMTEKIADEAQSWEYGLSATLLRDQLALLVANRDRAIEVITNAGAWLAEGYESFLAARDLYTSRMVEPWVHTINASGYQGGQDYFLGEGAHQGFGGYG